MADGKIEYVVDMDTTKATTGVSKLGTSLKTAAKIGVAGFAALGAGALATTKKVAATTDNIDKMSQTLGFSTEAYQEWDYVMSQSGITIDSMSMGIKTMTNLAESGSDAFDTLGVATKNNDGTFREQEDIFNDSIKALQGMEAGVEKTALAQELFGRNGQDLIPLLNQSAESTEELKNKASELGLVLNDETIQAGVDMTDSMDTLERSFGAAFTQLAGDLLPAMLDLSNWIIEDGIPALEGFISQLSELPQWLEENKTKLELLAIGVGTITALILVYNVQTALAVSETTLWAAIAGVATGVTTGLAAAFTFLVSPIGLVILAVGAVIAIGVLLYKNWDTISKGLVSMGEWAANNIIGFLNNIIDAINWAIGGINDLIVAANKVPGIDIAEIAEFSQIAELNLSAKASDYSNPDVTTLDNDSVRQMTESRTANIDTININAAGETDAEKLVDMLNLKLGEVY